jgi:hypothetical protein
VRLRAVHEFSAWTEDGGAAPGIICGWRVDRCGFGLFASRRKCKSGSRNRKHTDQQPPSV